MQPTDHPLAQFRFQVGFNPRFSDLDAFGHVNNARYLTYFEEGRVGYLRALGIFLPPASPISIIITRAECSYLSPVLHHHQVQVHVRAADWGRAKFTFHYAIWLPEEDLLAATGCTKAVAWHLGQRKPTAIPAEFLERMKVFEAGETL